MISLSFRSGTTTCRTCHPDGSTSTTGPLVTTTSRPLEQEEVVEVPIHSRKYPGLVALINADDLPLVEGYRWNTRKDGERFYAVHHVYPSEKKTTIRMHCLILPNPPEGHEIDHINRDGLDNRRSNLRFVTRGQNLCNRRPNMNGSSRFKGVHWESDRSRWIATVTVNGRRRKIGRFTDEIEAAHAADSAAIEHYGEHAYLNFPDEVSS